MDELVSRSGSIRASVDRARRHSTELVRSDGAEALLSSLSCPICLEIAQLPVNITCFAGGCSGTQARANGTCLRSALCQHCANDVLQLNRAPAERFAGEGEGGRARCLICRETSVRAAKLTPLRAYYVNHPLMDAMDKLALGAYCQKCDSEFPGQAALQAHYLKECPHAVVQCRFTGCPLFGVRASLTAHEYTCGMGRVVCAQCEEHVDRDELVDHMVATCRLRSVVCSLCNKRMRLPDMLQHLREHQAQLQMQVFVKKQRHSLSGSTASAGVSASGSSGPHRTSASANASGLSGLSGAGGPSRAGAGSGSSSSSGPSRAGASANASGLGGLTGPSGAGTSGGLSEAQQAQQQQQQQQQQQAQQPQQQPQQQQLRAPAPVSASLAAHGASLLGGAAPLGASERHAPMSTSPPQAPHAARPQHHHAEPPRRLSERVQAQVMSALSTPADVLCALGAPTFRRRRSGSGAATANAAQRQGQQGQQQQPGQQQQQGQRSGGAHGAAPSHLSAVAASLNSGGPALGAAAAAPIAWRGASPGTSASGTPSTSPTVACAVAAASALVWHAPPAPQWQQQQGQGQGQPAAPAGAGVQSSSSSSTLAAVEQQQQQQQAPASEQQRTASQSSLRSAPNSAPHSGPLQASTASGPAAAAPAAAPATAAAATAAAAAAAGDDATYPALSPSGLPPNEYRLLLEMLQSLTSRRDAAQQLLLQQEQQQQEQQQQGQQHGQQRGRSDGAATGIREGGPGGGAHDDAPALAPDAPASEQQHVLPLGAIGAGAGGSGEPEAVRSAFDATARGRDAGGSGGAGDSVSARSCSTSSSARSSGSGASDAGGAPRPQPSLPSTRLRAYPLPTRLPDRLGAHAFAAAPGSPIGSGSNATLFTIWRPRARSSSGHDAGGDAAAAGLEPGSTRASHEGEHGRSTLCAAAGGAGGVGRGTGSQGALMDQVDEAITMLAEHQADGHTARWGSGSLERSASDGEALRRYTAELCAARDAVSAMLLPAS